MRLAAVALIGVLFGGGALARDVNKCVTSVGPIEPDFALQHVAKAIADKRLDIVVMGSASSELNGPAGSSIAYPTRLQIELRKLLPGVTVNVSTFARPRETAMEQETKLEHVLADVRPALIVWQTGTADAIRGVDPDEFRAALDEGADLVNAAGADLVFMNMQYSPRTEAMLALGAYADAIRLIALHKELVVFDRFSVMKQWNENGVFDLYGATRKTDIAEKVHDCIGRLLAAVLVSGSKLTTADKKDTP
jgi:hypothetical protein